VEGVRVVIEIVGLVVLVGLIVLALVRWQIRRREFVALPFDRPVSPYPASRGFRFLDADGTVESAAAPEPPRIQADGELVFGDQPLTPSVPLTPQERHEDEWALAHATRRGFGHGLSRRRRRRRAITLGLVVVALVVLVLLGLRLFVGGPNGVQHKGQGQGLVTPGVVTTAGPAVTGPHLGLDQGHVVLVHVAQL